MKKNENEYPFYRGYPEILLTNAVNMSVIHDEAIPLLTLCIKGNICWCLRSDKLLQLIFSYIYSLTRDTALVYSNYYAGHFVLYLL